MKVKICGVTHPEDALFAARLGADYIGIIFSDRSKRKVEQQMGKQIAAAAQQQGATPVGVFVDESAEEILTICNETGIAFVQLHGAISQSTVNVLPFPVFYAIEVQGNRTVLETPQLPSKAIPLYDCGKGGSGIPFDWVHFSPPDHPWILAGGLHPGNVREAIDKLNPYGVDVATGVELPQCTRKDPDLLKAFIKRAKEKT